MSYLQRFCLHVGCMYRQECRFHFNFWAAVRGGYIYIYIQGLKRVSSYREGKPMIVPLQNLAHKTAERVKMLKK